MYLRNIHAKFNTNLFCSVVRLRFYSQQTSVARRTKALLTSSLKRKEPEVEKRSLYFNKQISLKVIGSGAQGAARSLAVYIGGNNILFNCGEGTYRVSKELPGQANFYHIFITHSRWENVSGIPGLRLSFFGRKPKDVPVLATYGASDFSSLWNSISNMDNLWIPLQHRGSSEKLVTIDDTIQVQPIILRKDGDTKPNPESSSSSNCAYAYMCHIPKKQMDVDINSLVKAGVPPGPMVTQLKKGNSITLEDGRVIQPLDVTQFLHGSNFIVVEAPDVDYVDSLVSSPLFNKFKPKENSPKDGDSCENVGNKSNNLENCISKNVPESPEENPRHMCEDFNDEDDPSLETIFKDEICGQNCDCFDSLALVVHFTPSDVMRDERYVNWVNSFPKSTKHFVINKESKGMFLEDAIKQQIVMNHLLPKCFPLFKNDNLKQFLPFYRNKLRKLEKEIESGAKTMNDYIEMHNSIVNSNSSSKCNNIDNNLGTMDKGQNSSNLDKHNKYGFDGKTMQANSVISYSVRPSRGSINTTSMQPGRDNGLISYLYHDEIFSEAITEMKLKFSRIEANIQQKPSPKISFLGTGSATSNSKRNASGILVEISPQENLILDCGDGTYNQLVTLEGIDKAREILINTKAIYVSHHHCDHHMGLLTLIMERAKAFEFEKQKLEKLVIMGPPLLFQYLKTFHSNLHPILNDLVCVNNMTLIQSKNCFAPRSHSTICDSLRLSNLETTFVHHCKDAFGISFEHKDGWKICYSGDCRPSPKLIDIGRDCNLLIHEATFADDLHKDAVMKKHCTISEALDISKKMKAKNVILTHFSQRYSSLPFVEDVLPDNVGLAFDFMQVTLNDLPYLPHLYPVLKIIHEEDYEYHQIKDHRRNVIKPSMKKWARANKELEIDLDNY